MCKKCGLEGLEECKCCNKLERVHKVVHEWCMSGRLQRVCTKVKVTIAEDVQVTSMAQVQRAEEGFAGDLPQRSMTFPPGFPIDFMGKQAGKVANDHIIAMCYNCL